jgi:hypothetical protein
MERPPGRFHRDIISDLHYWKQAVESYFDYYRANFSRKEDKIAWVEEILKDKALQGHQARARKLQKSIIRDNWVGYWQATDVECKNHHIITLKSCKLQKVYYPSAGSDWLVNLRTLNHTVASTGHAFRD